MMPVFYFVIKHRKSETYDNLGFKCKEDVYSIAALRRKNHDH